MKTYLKTFAGIFFYIYVIQDLFAQTDSTAFAINDSLIIHQDIFSIDSPLEITLKFDVKKYQNSSTDEKYIPAELSLHFSDSIPDKIKNVRVKPRGKNRKEACAWPPIKLNIKKTEISNKALQDVKNIKLVTHCRNNLNNSNFVLKEYLTYKIYEILSPYSFRVRLIKVKYIDTGRKDKETDTWAFLIEPENMMAERLNMFSIKIDNLSIQHTDTLWTNTMSLFQFMIGNADYSVAGRHNIKLLKFKEIDKPYPIPVPYDFDYAGIVDASYAIPGETLGINSVTERYFLGPCRNENNYKDVFNSFKDKQDEIYTLIQDFYPLSENEQNKIIKYLNEFFMQKDNDRYIKNYILSTCRE